MIELLKLFIEKPLNAIVAILAIATLTIYGMALSTEKAVAVIQQQQVTDTFINERVLEMDKTLVRIDENVKHMKETQNTNYQILENVVDGKLNERLGVSK